MSSIFGLVKFILIIAGTFFLVKKAERSGALRAVVIALGSFFLALFAVLVVFSIAGEFSAK